MPVVHALAARLRPEADPTLLANATAAGLALANAPGVDAARVGRSQTALVAAVWLADPESLEPFAASEPHMAFVMRGLAPIIEGMWSISLSTDHEPPAAAPAGSICAIALPQSEGVFEWQVRRQLEAIEDLADTAWTGPTVEERERYRAGGVALLGDETGEAFAHELRGRIDASLGLELASAPLTDDGAAGSAGA